MYKLLYLLPILLLACPGSNSPVPHIHSTCDGGQCVDVKDAHTGCGDCTDDHCEGNECPDAIGGLDSVLGCTSNKQCPAEKRVCEPDLHKCVACINDSDCPKGYCVDNECLDTLCKPNTKTCSKTGKARICNADGTKYQEEDCITKGLKCYQGECLTCIPGEKKCQGNVVARCNSGGTDYISFEDCKSSETGRACQAGECLDLCKENAKSATNLGCEYWPVDLQQAPKEGNGTMDPGNSQFAVVVVNTNKTITAKITIFKEGQIFKEMSAPPGRATIIKLPPYNVKGSMLETRAWRLVSNLPVVAYQFNPLENTGVFSNDASMLMPTNALGHEYMAVAYTQPNAKFGGTGSSVVPSAYITIVGTSKKDTIVKVTPTVKTMSGNNVQALNPGQTYQFTLKQYQVLNLNSNEDFGDLTGTIITSNQDVAVYAGNICGMVPVETCVEGNCTYEDNKSCNTSSDCPYVLACDHLEQQIFPLKAVGKKYVISKSWARGKAPDLIRVVAVENGTQVQVSPTIANIPVLNKGQHFDFEIKSNILLTAKKPVMVAQFLEGQNAPYASHNICMDTLLFTECSGSSSSGCECYEASKNPPQPTGRKCTTTRDCSPEDANIGDPTFILVVPVEQFRDNYNFFVPTKYADNYINIVAKQGSVVTLDGTRLNDSRFSPVQGSIYMVSKRKMTEGSHYIMSDKPMGIVVYGWDQYVSYGYPGGMNIETIYSH